jgi:hypothetical protein
MGQGGRKAVTTPMPIGTTASQPRRRKKSRSWVGEWGREGGGEELGRFDEGDVIS